MTPQQIDAMKLALEALEIEEAQTHYPSQFLLRAITAIKEVLAEHAMSEVQRLGQEIEQAPVAWVSEDVCKGQYIDGRPRKIWWECEKGVGTAFYTAPPQRTWVGLTDDELLEIYGWRKAPMLSDFIVEEAKQELLGALRKVEAKLKEKNT